MNGRISTSGARQDEATLPSSIELHHGVVTRPETSRVDRSHHAVMAIGLGVYLHKVDAATLAVAHVGGF